jgi:pimeloyl-ACP methyl ester carboxylesterase
MLWLVLQKATRFAMGRTAAVFDRAATLAAHAQSARARKRNLSESLPHEERLRLLGLLAPQYPSDGERFFREPRPIHVDERQVKQLLGGRVVDLAWTSDYEPYNPDVAERYLRYRDNHIAAARLFLHDEPRPVAVLIHGYLGGQYAVEQRVWPVDWLHRIGLDVALFVLPFHGVRGDARRRRPPPFPGSDPRVSNEGFRQAMGDLRDLFRWFGERGHPAVGAIGMSLGGYTTALLATVEPELAFGVPMIPLASLADFARDHGRLGTTPMEQRAQHRALDAVHRVVSPLHRKPLLPPERLLVIGAEADRITPLSHARRIARHFDAPLETWHGGHLLQLGRADKFRRIARMLGELGLTEPRR